MSTPPAATSLTRNHCLQFIADKVFPLRPREYCEKYPNWPGQVGIEIEMMPLLYSSDKGARFAALNGPSDEVTLETLLLELSRRDTSWQPEIDKKSGSILRVQLEQGDQLTFEPGGQLEFSSVPYPCLSDALRRMRSVQDKIDVVANELKIDIRQSGINPWQTPDEIGLQMRKPRYQAMTDYFNRIGPFGIRMMRQTCTVQVNLDFGPDETVMVQRFLLSQLLAPCSTAIFSNSPCVDNKLTDQKSFRSYIWRHVDSKRTGFSKGLANIKVDSKKSDLVEDYLEYVLAAPVVFVEAANYAMPAQDFTFGKWIAEGYKGIFPTQQDFETHLSLHFPEVRLRGFLELRAMDAQSRVWQSVPAGFNTALFYDPIASREALELLMPFHGREHDLWQRCSLGLQDPEIAELSQKVFQIAMQGLQRLPSCFREEFDSKKMEIFWEKFTSRRRAPADDMIDKVKDAGNIPAEIFRHLDDQWNDY